MKNAFKFFRETSIERFFIPLGIILIVLSIFFLISMNKTRNYIETEAVVSKIELYEEEHYDGDGNHYDPTYTVYVKYIVDGKEYDEEYGVFPNYKEGDKVTISYNPKKPNKIAQKHTVIWPIAFLVLGVASIIVGAVSFIKVYKKHKKMKLQEN